MDFNIELGWACQAHNVVQNTIIQTVGTERVQVTSNWGKQGETGVLWLQVEKTGGNLYLDMEPATEYKVRGSTATLV